MKRVAILLTTLTLSVGIAYAGGVVTSQNFQTMVGAGTLTFSNSNKTGTTDFVTYTCSGGKAKFAICTDVSPNVLGIYMQNSGAIVTTTTIENLDSLSISYLPSEEKKMKVYTSVDDGSSWTEQTVVDVTNGMKYVKLPSPGNYMLKITRENSDYYIDQINYVTAPPCNCLRVIVTE